MKFNKYLLLLFCLILGTYYVGSQNIRNESSVVYKGESVSIENALSMYIKYNSISGNEKAAGLFLKEICTENGLFVQQMGDENGNYNFIASLYPLSSQKPNIIFLNHIDVVPVGDFADWTYAPFSGEIVNNEIWGRGAFDNKGNAIMQLFSVLQIKKKYNNIQLPYNISMLSVSSEETQTNGGIKYVIANYFNNLNAAVVIGEGPPGIVGLIDSSSKTPVFSVSVAHKRALWLELELITETSGHGSITPLQYANKEMNTALYKLLKKKQKAIYTDLNICVLKQLGELQGGFKGWILKHPKLFKFIVIPQLRKQPELFSLFSNTITLTSIDSHGEAINVIPNKVIAHLDCRLLPLESAEDFMADLIKKMDDTAVKIKILKAMPQVENSSTKNKYFKNIIKALELQYEVDDVITMFSPNFNDLGIFRSKGIPGYGFTPVFFNKSYLEFIHNTNERIPVSILEKGKDTYVYFIDEMLKE
ncbi:M20/M25/M40 family metallo-hydrolase [Lutibacter sp. HS1-25]|uniref:M20/M25/M40 family metallo-hydrolase n=1 Tax=Lutibacter sp. HS1-25 TaxID=2485000 RepID=UPI001012885D|nr:M20/M25/M40 family metallo-hydrolase [Lutibacter sp. HS1-25]RXP55779.1 M20/M25/M40 family metallo-hydrolase [Lutibacter sp. HS1-25]